jgi:hypothetical protein
LFLVLQRETCDVILTDSIKGIYIFRRGILSLQHLAEMMKRSQPSKELGRESSRDKYGHRAGTEHQPT